MGRSPHSWNNLLWYSTSAGSRSVASFFHCSRGRSLLPTFLKFARFEYCARVAHAHACASYRVQSVEDKMPPKSKARHISMHTDYDSVMTSTEESRWSGEGEEGEKKTGDFVVIMFSIHCGIKPPHC